MKAQYVGDIGDFGKVLILKHLSMLGFKIGVNWLMTPADERSDGKHRTYAEYAGSDCLCCCDEEVFENILPLARKQRNERSIDDLQRLLSQFCKGITYFTEPYLSRRLRKTRDSEAFEKLKQSDLVFFDPDNGIDTNAGSSEKHVYLPEMKRYWDRKQSLLIYHHLNRSGSHAQQVDQLTKFLKHEMTGGAVEPYRLCRGTARAYFLVVQPEHSKKLVAGSAIPSIAALQVQKPKWAMNRKPCTKSHGS